MDTTSSVMDQRAKAKLYRLLDTADWEELGIGYATCARAAHGGYDIVLDPLESDVQAQQWRQTLNRSTNYDIDELIIQWQIDALVEHANVQPDDDDAVCSYALSFETEDGCQNVLSQIKQIQFQMRLEEKEYDFDEFKMPDATLVNLPAIEELLKSCQSHMKKHTVSNYLENTNYIDGLLNLLDSLEVDESQTDTLQILFRIVKAILGLNTERVMKIMLQDQNFKNFFGLMEYNPDEIENPCHRDFIEKEVRYVEVIPVEASLKQLIHYTFRLGYLRDIHPGVLDDPMVTRITNMIGLNNAEIVRQLNSMNDAMELILTHIRSPEQSKCTRTQALSLLFEYCNTTATNPLFPPNEKANYFREICTQSFFETLRTVLRSCDMRPSIFENKHAGGENAHNEANKNIATKKEMRAIVARILKRVMEHSPSTSRKFMLESDPMPKDLPATDDYATRDQFIQNRQEDHSLLLCIIRLITDCEEMGVQADGHDALRSLLDPGTMTVEQKDKFLLMVYDQYMSWLVSPLAKLGHASIEQLTAESSASKHAKGLLCRLLSFCVEHHKFRIKYFSIKNNIIGQLMQLCRYPQKSLRLGGIRFVRKCIAVKDTFFPRYIVKHDLFKLMFQVLDENGTKNTMTRSTISEMMSHICSVPIKPLVSYVVTKYNKNLDLLPCKDLTRTLRLKYEQIANGESSRRNATTLANDTTTKSAMDFLVQKQQKRYREAMSDESYFDTDDDDDISNVDTSDKKRVALQTVSGASMTPHSSDSNSRNSNNEALLEKWPSASSGAKSKISRIETGDSSTVGGNAKCHDDANVVKKPRLDFENT